MSAARATTSSSAIAEILAKLDSIMISLPATSSAATTMASLTVLASAPPLFVLQAPPTSPSPATTFATAPPSWTSVLSITPAPSVTTLPAAATTSSALPTAVAAAQAPGKVETDAPAALTATATPSRVSATLLVPHLPMASVVAALLATAPEPAIGQCDSTSILFPTIVTAPLPTSAPSQPPLEAATVWDPLRNHWWTCLPQWSLHFPHRPTHQQLQQQPRSCQQTRTNISATHDYDGSTCDCSTRHNAGNLGAVGLHCTTCDISAPISIDAHKGPLLSLYVAPAPSLDFCASTAAWIPPPV
ncbi:mucin-2-like [Panicum hallii]|nr:mucin-2-like [Panicum hallii]